MNGRRKYGTGLGIELATPGYAVNVTDCAMAHRYLSYIYSRYVNKLSFCVVIRDLKIGQVYFIAVLV